jgi:hypothetical protein
MSFVGDIIGGFVQDRAAKRADNTMREATANEIAENRRQYDTTRADFEPWRDAGGNALSKLMSELDKPTTAADVTQDPGYQFGMQQGEQALSRRVAASGGRVSGAALKAASRFGTDYGASGYGAAYQRGQERLRRLENIAGLGQTATSNTTQAGQFSAGNIGRAMSNQGEATAASQLRRGNIWANTTNKLISSAGGYFGG